MSPRKRNKYELAAKNVMSVEKRLSKLVDDKVKSEELIYAIKKCPCIWDSTTEDFLSSVKKKNTWKSIIKTFIEDFDDRSVAEKYLIVAMFKKKWKSIKDSYTRELKRQAEGNVDKIRPPYIYSDILRFLDTSKNKTGNSMEDSVHDDVTVENEEETGIVLETALQTESSMSEEHGKRRDMLRKISEKRGLIPAEDFISEVKKHAIIWDSSKEEYIDRVFRHKTWQSITRKFIQDYDDKPYAERESLIRTFQRRWKSLRDCYVRELAARRKEEHEGLESSRKPYEYFDLLDFLRNQSRKVKNQRNITKSENDLSLVEVEVNEGEGLETKSRKATKTDNSRKAENSLTLMEVEVNEYESLEFDNGDGISFDDGLENEDEDSRECLWAVALKPGPSMATRSSKKGSKRSSEESFQSKQSVQESSVENPNSKNKPTENENRRLTENKNRRQTDENRRQTDEFRSQREYENRRQMEYENRATNDQNEDRLFLLSLVTELQKVPQGKKLKLKADIIQAIDLAQRDCPPMQPPQQARVQQGYPQSGFPQDHMQWGPNFVPASICHTTLQSEPQQPTGPNHHQHSSPAKSDSSNDFITFS